MNKFVTVLLFLIISFCLTESDVIILNPDNFDEELKKHENLLVKYYAPWCGHCKAIKPHFEKAATTLKDKNIKLASLDCDKHQDLARKHEIQGFPTLKLYKNGEFVRDYDGARSHEGIVNWLKKATGPPAKTLNTKEEIDAFVKEVGGTAVVGFFEKDSEEHKKFLAVAKDPKVSKDFSFGEVFDEKLGKKNTYKLFRSFDKDLVSDDFKRIKDFILNSGYPLVEEISAQNFQRYVDSGLILSVLFIDYTKEDEKKKAIDTITEVAKKTKLRVNWAYSDGVEYKEQIKAMGGDPEVLPSIAAMNIEGRKNFPYTGKFEVESIKAWALDVVSGKVKPFLKSQPIPEKNDGPVKVIVGKSFNDEVINNDKYVLVEFYAPWCGHCKNLEPKYVELGKKFKDNDKVVIAKVDATENDTPARIEGFPTILLYADGKKDKPIPYEGARTTEAMEKFILEHVSKKKEEL